MLITLVYLLWPLSSSQFSIDLVIEEMKIKNAYLDKQTQHALESAPNVLLITVDDLGMADVSLYEEGNIVTPNIDLLGREGVVFENAYVTSPVCAPSRAALITGRYQHRFGFEFTMHERYLRNRLEYFGFRYFVNSYPWEAQWQTSVPNEEAIHQQGLPLSEISLAEVFKKHGYKTGIIGKWHLGWSKDKRPSAFGFDEQYGFFNSHSLYAPEGSPGIIDQKIDEDWTDPYIWKGQRQGSHAIYRNYEEEEETEYLTDRITEESIDYIKKHKENPFFLWVSYNAPHTPLQAPASYVEKFLHVEDPVKRVYQAMISNLDDNLGKLMKFLELQNLDSNTFVILISDNGGAEYTFTTDNGKYAGGKNTEFEGGVKVPMIMRWPGKIPSEKRFESMVSALDIFPTALASAGITTLSNRPLDGVNLFPFIQDSLLTDPHEYLFWKRGISEVVRGNEWKLMMNGYSGDTMLYNLLENRYEDPDLYLNYPDEVLRLSQALDNWKFTHQDPMWPPVIYFIGNKGDKEVYFDQ